MSLINLNSDIFSTNEIRLAKKSITKLINNKSKGNRNENDFYIFNNNSTTVGCAGYSNNDDTQNVYTLNWLAVHSNFKRQKIATKLYIHIETAIKKLNAKLIIANAGSNEINQFFYKSVGFNIGGIIPKYYSEIKDLVWYYKFIDY